MPLDVGTAWRENPPVPPSPPTVRNAPRTEDPRLAHRAVSDGPSVADPKQLLATCMWLRPRSLLWPRYAKVKHQDVESVLFPATVRKLTSLTVLEVRKALKNHHHPPLLVMEYAQPRCALDLDLLLRSLHPYVRHVGSIESRPSTIELATAVCHPNQFKE